MSTIHSDLPSSEPLSRMPLDDGQLLWPGLDRMTLGSSRSSAELARYPIRETLAQVHPSGNRSLRYRVLKRLVDVVGAVLLLILLSPVLMATFVVLWITTRGRPFFVQERVGYCGRRFLIFKFRTMVPEAELLQDQVENQVDGPIFKNCADPRVTRLGKFLRITSIDETPQLMNVLLGDMSLVGPRPHPVYEVAEYQPWHLQRLAVKPGLTGLWQIAGRSELGFEEGLRMDLWYVKHQGLLTDLLLICRTPWCVLSGRGAY